ncbi:MAG TPA: ribosome maturation factor RimM [Solirubrobacteraceae bacterium]|nr:ribosome maturation factor RimM [Solirubrobacteraceae bacterium]
MGDAPEESVIGLQAGRVGRPHGLDGSFYVTGPLTRLLTLGTSVTVEGRSAEIVRRAGTEQRPILRLAGVEDRAAAEALRGKALNVAQADAPQLGEGEWWAHELEGCAVLDERGRALGAVERLIELPSCEALEVARGAGRQPLIVPMVKDAIRTVDVRARRIEVDTGFLDVETAAGGADGD